MQERRGKTELRQSKQSSRERSGGSEGEREAGRDGEREGELWEILRTTRRRTW
jgi:hypothetical protein